MKQTCQIDFLCYICHILKWYDKIKMSANNECVSNVSKFSLGILTIVNHFNNKKFGTLLSGVQFRHEHVCLQH